MANLVSIPNFVKAASPLGLRRLMLKVQMQNSEQYAWTIQFANGEWFAWYYEHPRTDTQKLKTLQELGDTNGISKR
jgi:hypothetical protein